MRFLIADDHAIVRLGLIAILKVSFCQATFGEAACTQEVLEQVARQDWDIVILDVSMPGRSGLEALAEIRRLRPKLPVLILSIQPEDQYGLRVIKDGANGFLNKNSAPETLVFAVKKILARGKYVSQSLAEILANHVTNGSDRPLEELLSDREYEIYRKIVLGTNLTAIAEELSLSVKTISTYRARVLEKLGLETNADLIRHAMTYAIVKPPAS